MSGLLERVRRLHAERVSSLTSKITITKDNKVIKQSVSGNNKNKVVEIVVRF